MNLEEFKRVVKRVKESALASIDSLLPSWLPNGVVEGREFRIGSRHGEAGRSMSICLRGEKAGYWADFEAGESGFDLVSLYAYIENMSQGKACVELAKQFGIALPDSDLSSINSPKPQKPAPAPAMQGVEKKKAKLRTAWEPILPVPDDAGPYPIAHPVRGIAAAKWEYRDQERRLLGVIYRFVTSDGGKEVLPCVYARNAASGKSEWHWMSFPEPRPLYLTGALRDGFPVLVVEGEKCADAAYAMAHAEYDVISWPGGGNAVKKADWSPLAGRELVLWADADAKAHKDNHPQAGQIMDESAQPGMKAMNAVRDIVSGLGCCVRFIDIPEPGVKPDGWDVADLIQIDGGGTDEVLTWCRKLRPAAMEYPPLPATADNAPLADDVPDWAAAPPDTSTPLPAGADKADRNARRSLRAMMLATANGGVKGCRENVYMALQNDARLIGLIGFDQFTQLQVKLRPTPWKSEEGEWTEQDDFHLGAYLAHEYGLVMASVGEIEKAVAVASREYSFNPVADYLTECKRKWDGVERVHEAFSTFWGTPPSVYARLIARMFFVSLVARAFDPGCKSDCAPVFEGGQGEGKSTALSVLGGQWFADTPFRMGDKDGYLSIQGIWIYEIAELEQFNRSEVTAVKSFMSSSKDRYREPYGRRTKNVLRRTVFAATTNEGQYFKDPTGNRRFWPLLCGLIDIDGLRKWRDQLFGEAVHMYEEGLRWHPTRDEQKKIINEHQDSREIPDQWIVPLYNYCEGLSPEGTPIFGARLNKVSGYELLTKALHIDCGKIGPAKSEEMRVSVCMRKLGWLKKRESGGAREYFYERPPAPHASPVERKDDVVIPF